MPTLVMGGRLGLQGHKESTLKRMRAHLPLETIHLKFQQNLTCCIVRCLPYLSYCA